MKTEVHGQLFVLRGDKELIRMRLSGRLVVPRAAIGIVLGEVLVSEPTTAPTGVKDQELDSG